MVSKKERDAMKKEAEEKELNEMTLEEKIEEKTDQNEKQKEEQKDVE